MKNLNTFEEFLNENDRYTSDWDGGIYIELKKPYPTPEMQQLSRVLFSNLISATRELTLKMIHPIIHIGTLKKQHEKEFEIFFRDTHLVGLPLSQVFLNH